MSPEVHDKIGPLPLVTRPLDSGSSRGIEELQVVWLHGFSQNSFCMGETPALVGRSTARVRLRSVGVDLAGHGNSQVTPPPNLWESADLVAKTTGRAAYVGYSMGGRLALHLALAHPELVDALVLIGSTAGIEDPGLRRDRAERDLALAESIVDNGIDWFVEYWLGQPMFAGLPATARFEVERMMNNPVELAASLRLCGTGSMEPLWDRLHEISCPTLVLAGELDRPYQELGLRIAKMIGENASFELIEDSGHSVHLERPEQTAQVIARFLDG